LILVVNYRTAEFRDRFFGVDYNSEFMKWIREHYHLSARFGPPAGREPRLGDEAFFILAYERNA